MMMAMHALRGALQVPVGPRSKEEAPGGPRPGDLVVKHTFLEFVDVATPIGRARIRASTDSVLLQTGKTGSGVWYAAPKFFGTSLDRASPEDDEDVSPAICEGYGTAEAAEDNVSGDEGGDSDDDRVSEDCADAESAISEDGSDDDVDATHTTLMMRNLPNNYTRSMVLMMLDNQGFNGQYDFVYLPVDFGSSANLGYAFVNLVSASVVRRFWKKFDGFSEWDLPSSKICHVDWSGPHQGLEAHVERYRNSPVMHKCVPDGYKPVLFEAGQRVPFPPPTKALQPPRARRPDAHGGRRRFMLPVPAEPPAKEEA